jgi:cysteinyl-tRNA synthetase
VRLLLLRARYRAVLDFTDAGLVEAREEMDRFYRALQKHPDVAAGDVPAGFLAALCDDVNTPAAIAEMHVLANAALAGDAAAASGLRAAGGLLGLLQGAAVDWFQAPAGGDAPGVDVEAAIRERNAARKARDFARADAIRKEMAAAGVLLEDGPGGTTWRRVN